MTAPSKPPADPELWYDSRIEYAMQAIFQRCGIPGELWPLYDDDVRRLAEWEACTDPRDDHHQLRAARRRSQ
jgi:hypothetical protein